MLFSAGLGTRLRPYTDNCPKALVEIDGCSLLEINLGRLVASGFEEVVINLHHYGDQIIDFLGRRKDWGIRILLSDERMRLLDTGGGLLKARPLLDGQPFLIHNVDILSDIDLAALFAYHRAGGQTATLAIRERSSSRQLLFDAQRELCGWAHSERGEYKWRHSGREVQPMAYSGIAVLSPSVFNYMPGEEGAVFSIIDTFLRVDIAERVIGYPHREGYWLDVGKPAAVATAAAWIQAGHLAGCDR